MSAYGLKLGVYALFAMAIALVVREYARARIASSLGDPTPRLWGRTSLRPRAWVGANFDPFGTGVLPVLIALLITVAAAPAPMIYAKPPAMQTSYLRGGTRDIIIVSISGPVANIVLGLLAGLAIRIGVGGEVGLILRMLTLVSMSVAVFHLMPIPGLDGARMLGLVLPAHAARVYAEADKYLPLFIVVVLFVFSGPLEGIVRVLVNLLCQMAAGTPCL